MQKTKAIFPESATELLNELNKIIEDNNKIVSIVPYFNSIGEVYIVVYEENINDIGFDIDKVVK